MDSPFRNIRVEEVKRTLRGMKNKKAPGPTGLTSGILRKLENSGVVELKRIFKEVAEEVNIPKDWKRSVTIRILKGKCDPLQGGKYQ
jgi:predicted transcriptional regulator YheO